MKKEDFIVLVKHFAKYYEDVILWDEDKKEFKKIEQNEIFRF